MPHSELPQNVQELLAERIESFEQLEVLLRLFEGRSQSWTADSLAEQLNIPVAAVLPALAHLRAVELLVASGEPGNEKYGYAPRDAEADQAVRALAEVYRTNRLSVLQLMSANAIDRVRSRAIRLFADSFLLGRSKSKKDG